MYQVDFFKQSRIVQDRFIAAIRGQTVPQPVLLKVARRRIPFAWFGAGVVLTAVFIILVSLGFGELESRLAIASTAMLIAFVIAISAALCCVLVGVARLSEEAQLPFPRGQYLFPFGVVDATGYRFRVWPIVDLASSDIVAPSTLRLSFTGGATFSFDTRDEGHAEKAKEWLSTAQQEWTKATESGTPRDVAQLNPLVSTGFSSPFAPSEPLERPVPFWLKLAPLVALVLGAGIAYLVWLQRNQSSEEALFEAARAENTPAAYRAYLERGGGRDEVEQELLPLAELAALDGLEDIERYAEEHAESKVRPQIDRALRDALLEQLEAVRQQGTITAVNEFTAKHPAHTLIAAELEAARNAIGEQALLKFQEHAPKRNKELVPFMERLIAYTLKHGPKVHLRFQRITSPTVAVADERVKKNRYFAPAMLPSQYFDAAHYQRREDAFAKRIMEKFSETLPEDVVHVEYEPAIMPDAKPPEQFERPTLLIIHQAAMSGGIQNRNPHGTFVGVGFKFDAQFRIPGDENPLRFRYSLWRPPDLLSLRKGKITIPQVYETMGDEAFEKLEAKYLSWMFR